MADDNTDNTEFMLTTVDNPFDPFTMWNEWLAWDINKGYNTCSFLARVCMYSDDLSEADQELAISTAIDEIVQENVSGVWKKISREEGAKLIT